ncbi:PepSY-associated TM helix domain-containing protein [Parasphingopyxis marina]|uniref:PepSY domain-containing protein n=1 Tax=Parasphingopyxis marina TaxID=2761622 RepID=A0A842HXW9_9SPHN|nr:PepSY-associated TM helix domain-containing protein [Parasphingopyxis marina]MBC2777191.1 PepSY domain-containing protein [Parasphingopyxis marina]
MTQAPSLSLVKRALSAHAAIGLLGGALLYLVCLTGTIVVFYEEFHRIEQQDAPEMAEVDPGAVQRAVEAVLASEAGQTPTTHLYVHIPVADLPRTTITTDTQAVHVDRDGTIAAPEENGWSEFLLALHYTLNLPVLIGITIVGILGVMILALALSGVVAHPRIFRDAFRLRTRSKGGVALADWHNRLSVWTLPFSVAVALTGSIIGLATVTGYGMAAHYYDGDIEALYAPIFGGEAEADPAPAGIPNVAAALRHMQTAYAAVEPTYVIVHDPGTAGQHIQIVAEHSRRLIFGEYYAFDAEGNFEGTAGMADGAIGQQAAASTYNLHFGNYGGLPVKIAYFLFGLALTAICATGTYIWLGKRRRRGLNEPRLLAAWDGVVWGVPIALTATFLARLAMGNGAPFTATFWLLGFAIVIANILLANRYRTRRPLQAAFLLAVIASVAIAL